VDHATEVNGSKKLFAASTISATGFLLVSMFGGYTIYTQNKTTQQELRKSQARSDAVNRAQVAILTMGKAEAQLVSASDVNQAHAAALLAIQASSILDESVQRLDQTLAGSAKVAELSRSLREIGPIKMAVISAVRANDGLKARTEVAIMQQAMSRIERISGELVQEESSRLLSAVVNQGKQANATLRVLGILFGCCFVLSLFAGRELKKRTHDLARARRESELFIHCVPSILIGTDEQGRIKRWNASAEDALGLSFADVYGKALGNCGVKWSSLNLQTEIESWATIEDRRRYDDVAFMRGSETRLLGLTVNPLRFDDKQAPEFLLTGADVTERRSMERELRQAQKLEAIGHLSAGIAHEINTPVQYVQDNVRFSRESWTSADELLSLACRMRADMVNGECAQPSVLQFDTRWKEIDFDYLQKEVPIALDQSLDGLGQIGKIVGAMKVFSHPGSIEKAPIDINRAIESTITVARSEWKYVADVSTDFDETLPPVPCYAGEFNQVILNLLVNASHAVGDVVKDSGGKGAIALKTRRDGPWVEIRLSDSGGGIPEEISSKVFDPFFTTKEVGKGTGQGLALAHSVVVKKHSGKIWFENTPGKGCTFIVRLPLL
jgi:PAS domain S-box-containing protein